MIAIKITNKYLAMGFILIMQAAAASNSWANPLAWFSGDSEPSTATVTDAFIEMRTGPGRGYPIFYVAERGETVTVLKQRTDWIKVRNHKSVSGWVHVGQMSRTLAQNGEPLPIKQPDFNGFKKRRWETGVLLGDFGGADAITAYGGWHFTRNLSAEIALSQTFGNFSDGRAATFNIVHQPFPNWRISPFITLGGGIRETNPRSSLVSVKDRQDNELNSGLGLRIYLVRGVMLRAQYINHTILTNRDDDEEIAEWQLGISTFF